MSVLLNEVRPYGVKRTCTRTCTYQYASQIRISRFICDVYMACCASIPVYSKGNFEEVYIASI